MNIPPYCKNMSGNSDNRLIDRRQIWATNRFWMEMQNLKTGKYGNRGKHHWHQLFCLMKAFKFFLLMTGMYSKGKKNAEEILVREIPLIFPDLPPAFDGFTILHLSDLHLDGMEGLTHRIVSLLEQTSVDLCIFTGDYRTALHGPHKHIIKDIAQIIKGIDSRHGFLGILGNHDGCHMVNPMEEIGIKMLINSSHTIKKEGQNLLFIGVDDVHYYYTDQAVHALEHAEKEFSIALVHSPELYAAAAQMGINLYLCGHTHGGQVCLPGGKAILTHLNEGKKYYRGIWQHGQMTGITHTGVGTSGIPVRFNTRGEILIHKLIRQTPNSCEKKE